MNWYALCHVGAEAALGREFARFGVGVKQFSGGCEFSCDKKTAAAILYKTQVATRMLLAVTKGSPDNLDITGAEKHIPKDATFKVECSFEAGAASEITQNELAAQYGEQISRQVNLTNPDITIYCQVTDVAVCGIDVAADLSKRYYRVFTGPRSIKGTVAASLLWLFPTSGELLDPFGFTGEIAIEAALFHAQVSPLKYKRHQKLAILDKEKEAWEDPEPNEKAAVWCFDPLLSNIRSAKKNAKLAGIEKSIQFSKLEAEWMDYKFSEHHLGAIITVPPPITNRKPESKHLKELFYQASYVLKPEGKIILACLTPDTAQAAIEFANQYDFKLVDQAIIFSGKFPIQVMCYGM